MGNSLKILKVEKQMYYQVLIDHPQIVSHPLVHIGTNEGQAITIKGLYTGYDGLYCMGFT
jgi:hypothetical protein